MEEEEAEEALGGEWGCTKGWGVPPEVHHPPLQPATGVGSGASLMVSRDRHDLRALQKGSRSKGVGAEGGRRRQEGWCWWWQGQGWGVVVVLLYRGEMWWLG